LSAIRPAAAREIKAMPDDQHADRAGVELASEVLPSDHRQVLLAFLVRGKDGGDALELGAWAVTDAGKLVRPAQLLVFPVGDVDKVRALAERASAALPHVDHGQDGGVVLGRAGELEAALTRGSDGAPWATLGRVDGGGLAAVPAVALGRLVRVLAEAERELAELGLVALLRDPQA
jgi:hypothetical protein